MCWRQWGVREPLRRTLNVGLEGLDSACAGWNVFVGMQGHVLGDMLRWNAVHCRRSAVLYYERSRKARIPWVCLCRVTTGCRPFAQ